MDQNSPPRKKLKQARLPFQVIRQKKPEAEPVSEVQNKKRKLSEEAEDDCEVVKVFKSVRQDETKENKSTPKSDADVVTVEDSPAHSEKELQEDVSFKNHIRLNLSSLFGKKALPIKTIPVDPDVDSADEAVETNDNKHTISGKRKRCSPEVAKKFKAKNDEKLVNITPVDKSTNVKDNTGKANLKLKDDSKLQGTPATSHDAVEVCSAAGLSKTGTDETVEADNGNKSFLSKKAFGLFASWKKQPQITPTKTMSTENNGSPELALEATDSTVKRCIGSNEGEIEDSMEPLILEQEKNIETGNKQEEETNVSHDVENKTGNELNNEDSSSDINAKELNENSNEQKGKSEVEEMSTPKSERSPENSIEHNENVKIKEVEPTTPKSSLQTPHRKLTPKQLEQKRKSAHKHEERERLKQEREMEKNRLKLEKEEQRKKEKEDKEMQKLKEKEEKEEQKRKSREEKEEQKRKEREEKVKQKDEEKRKKEELKAEEKRKLAKASAMFTSFFVAKSLKTEKEEPIKPLCSVQHFMPFEVKADMRIAPLKRTELNSSKKCQLDEYLSGKECASKTELYINCIRSGEHVPQHCGKTWMVNDVADNDVIALEPDESGVFIEQPKKYEKMKSKFLQFHENYRPAYRGTWRKKSKTVSGRRPFKQDEILDYEVDSADEWEEEEPGESLHGSDDEKEQESEDDYEVDNTVFVPHGYLSDDEGDAEIDNEVLSPETQKAKLKLLGEEFEAQMKTKTTTLKPIIIVLTAALQANLCSPRYQKLFERRAVWCEDKGPIDLSLVDKTENREAILEQENCNSSSKAKSKKGNLSESAIPALITLIHGNRNKRKFLVQEFSAFLKKYEAHTEENNEGHFENASSTSENNSDDTIFKKWPSLPPASLISISRKIKELATYGRCPEEGPYYNRYCWFVPSALRDQYGLCDLKLPNTAWPQTFNSLNGGESRASLITNFTKVMTPEEKQKEWQRLKEKKNNTPKSEKCRSGSKSSGKILAFTCPLPNVSGSSFAGTSVTEANKPQIKKRVPILVSVPRGEEISNTSRQGILSKLTDKSKCNSSENKEISKSDVECVTLE